MKDVIVVLAGGINKDGTLPNLPKKRVDLGVTCFSAGEASKIVMTGKYGFWLDWKKDIPVRGEAVAMKEYAISLGIPDDAILIEEDSKDTLGNAYFTKINILEPNNWKNIILITSDFHYERTKLIFELVLGPEYCIEYKLSKTDLPEEKIALLREQETKTITTFKKFIGKTITPGDSEAVHKFLFTKHPGYASNPEYSFEKLFEMLGRE